VLPGEDLSSERFEGIRGEGGGGFPWT
jgi:hypothetical protein